MIEQSVRVIHVHDGQISVRLGGQGGCVACESGRGCGSGLFAKLFRGKPVILVLPEKEMVVKTGQMLVLGIPESLYLRLVWAVFGLPLLAALVGASFAHFMVDGYGLGSLQSDMVILLAAGLAAWSTLWRSRRRMHSAKVRHFLQSLDYYPAADAVSCAPLPSQTPVIDK